MIENLVRENTGGHFGPGKMWKGLLVWQEHRLKQVGTQSLDLCLKVSSLVFATLLHHT